MLKGNFRWEGGRAEKGRRGRGREEREK